ncbi:hypothetical protein ULF88_11955 [Halopseudomonas pachastrellae]|nr:hypothetical protein [Halopseudomonas pachastrellae]
MRRRSSILLLIFLLLTLLVLLARLWGQQQLQAAGVQQLDWQGLGWREGALQVDELHLQMQDGLRLTVQQARLQPGWRDGPRLRTLQQTACSYTCRPRGIVARTAGLTPVAARRRTFWRRLADWARTARVSRRLTPACPAVMSVASWQVPGSCSVPSRSMG